MESTERNSLSFDELQTENFPKWKETFLKEIWNENNLQDLKFFREQVDKLYHLSNTKYNSMDYLLTYKDMGTLFGVSKQRISNIIKKQQKIKSGYSPKSPGRQSILSTEQKNNLKVWIGEMHKNKTPPSLTEVTDYITETLQVECSSTWINKWVSSDGSGLYLIEAKPLEKERIDVSVDVLNDYGKRLTEELKNIDPEFLFNLDETGLDDRKYNNKTVVSLEQTPTCYKVAQPPGHISICPIICSDGTKLPPLVVISRKSISNDLLRYGYPKGENGYIVSSDKGYMTTDLFENYIEEIFIPHLNRKRQQSNKPNNPALIILDGFRAHSSPKLDALQKDNNWKLFFLPPHSSHLTQPLDLLIFGAFKKLMLRLKTSIDLNPLSKRIFLALKGIDMATNFFDNITSFSRAGFVINLEETKRSVSFDISKVLKNDRAPENDLKLEENKNKRKRTTLKHGGKKTKKQKTMQVNNNRDTNNQ